MQQNRLVFVTFLITAIVSACVPGQDRQAIGSDRIAIPGLTILPPQGGFWSLFPVTWQDRVPAGAMIRFVHRISDAKALQPADARSLLAGVVVQDSGDVTTRMPEEFLDDFKAEFVRDGKIRVGEMITSRQRLLAFDAVREDSLRATCVRYNRLTEITGQFPAFPDLVANVSTQGLFCAHPQWPRYHVDVTYQQVYAKGQAPLARDAEAESFLKSIYFTPDQPSAVNPKQ